MTDKVGTIGNDYNLIGIYGENVYGLQGNDVLSSSDFSSEVGLVGGSGDDTYMLGSHSSVEILEAGNSSNDTVIDNSDDTDGVFVEIDGRHLFWAADNGEYFIVIDWKRPENIIEGWISDGQRYTFNEFQSLIYALPDFERISMSDLSQSWADGFNHYTTTAYANAELYEDAATLAVMPSYTNGVYRFYNETTGRHFYTASVEERNYVATSMEDTFRFEGTAFGAANEADSSSVYRFYNATTNAHFYTISASERDNVINTLPQFNYEGVAYQAYTSAGAGHEELYRFYNNATGAHFYTASEAERDNVINTMPTFHFEGVAFYVDGIV